MKYILVVQIPDYDKQTADIVHVSAHKTQAEAERKAETISRKSKRDLFAHVYDMRTFHPSTWADVTSIML